MGEENGNNLLSDGGNENGAVMLPVPVSAFHPGIIWKVMGFVWRFPNWHGAWLRGEKKGLLTYQKVDAGEPETVLAARTLDELRGLALSIISCGRSHRPDIAGAASGFKKIGLAVQAVFGTNRRSLCLHDRVSIIPSLSGLLDHHCVVCSFFHAFRHLVSTRTLDEQCGTPNDWELSLTGGGNTALLELLRKFERIGAENGIGIIHADDLRRFPAFVVGLMNIAAQPGGAGNSAVSTPAPSIQDASKEADKAEAPAPVNIMLVNQTPVNVTLNQEAHAVAASATVNAPDSRNGGDETQEPGDRAATDTGATDGQDGKVEAQESPSAAEAATDDTDDADSQGGKADTQEQADNAEAEGVPSDSQGESRTHKKRKGNKGKRTSKYLQYHVFRVLYDMHCENPDATMTADDLFRLLRSRNIECIDTVQCHRAIDDLRNLFKQAHIDASIPGGDYRLVKGKYLHSRRIEKALEQLKQEAEKQTGAPIS